MLGRPLLTFPLAESSLRFRNRRIRRTQHRFTGFLSSPPLSLSSSIRRPSADFITIRTNLGGHSPLEEGRPEEEEEEAGLRGAWPLWPSKSFSLLWSWDPDMGQRANMVQWTGSAYTVHVNLACKVKAG